MNKLKELTDSEFQDLLDRSGSLRDIARNLGDQSFSSCFRKYLSNKIKTGVTDGKWSVTKYEENKKSRKHYWGEKKHIDEYLVAGRHCDGQRLKKRLIEEKYKVDICERCGQLPWWCGEPLILQLDHINGDSSDNRLENLRIICPNCHTQTETFSGRNVKTVECEVKTVKQCTLCKVEKTLTDFNKNGSRADGYQNVCRTCNKDKCKKYYEQKKK